MNGVGGGRFAPDINLTRGTRVQILYNREGRPEGSPESDFSDVASSDWYYDAINWAAANKIVDGYEGGVFKPEKDISREEMALIFYRYAEFKGYDMSPSDDLTGFTDGEAVSSWALTAVKWSVGTGLIEGIEENVLGPGNTALRCQIATILVRFCETIAK